MGNQRRLLAVNDMPHDDPSRHRHARRPPCCDAVCRALQTLLLDRDTDVMRVVGQAPTGGDFIEIVIDEGPLREAMLRFSRNILLLSLVISAITATLVYLALHYLFVRPMHRITANMMAFRARPGKSGAHHRAVRAQRRDRHRGARARRDAARSRLDAAAEEPARRARARGVQDQPRPAQPARLGAAVLRPAVDVPDPNVQRFAPKLMRALERAIAFCQSTLSYGRAQEPPPDRRPVLLETLVEEVRETLGLGPDARSRWIARGRARARRSMPIHDQLFRVLLNLAAQRVQALEERAPNDPGRDQIRITGRREGAVVVIEVSDTGPGVSAKARAHLFEAFQGSTRPGGSGLGLAIAAELVRAHGGEIRLVDGTIGATFRIIIPDRAVELGARRGERARA